MEIQKQGIGWRIWRIFSIPASCKEKKNMVVALYARVFATKQAEKNPSIPDQLKRMWDWCKAQGWVVAVE
jgi:hypothetical protein